MLFVDLTLSDEEGGAAPPLVGTRRSRPQPTSSGSSDVVVVVGDEVEAKRQRVEPGGEDEALGDEELAVVGETGKTALRDFPHPRDTCCVNPFSKGVKQENSKRCPQCFCWVCDDNANKCEFWGTGSRARDHCNAYECSYWISVKKVAAKRGLKDLLKAEFESSDAQLISAWEKNSSATSAHKHKVRNGTPMGGGLPGLWARHASNTAMANSQARHGAAATAALTPPGAAAAAAAGVTPTTPAAVAATLKAEHKQQTPEVPARPPASSWLQKMPHPNHSKDPVQLLATLDLPFKTTKGITVTELQRRLVASGFYKGVTNAAPQYGEHVWLENINEARYNAAKRKEKADFINLLPLVPPGGLPAEPSRLRTWKFIVIPYQADFKPVALAVTVERECRMSALTAAVREQLGSSISSTDELLFMSKQTANDMVSWLKASATSDGKLTDDRMTEQHWVHFAIMVPKSALPPATPPGVFTERAAPRLAIIMHEKTVPAEPQETPNMDSDEDDYNPYTDDSDDGCGYGCGGVYGRPRRMLGGARPRRETPPKAVRFGLPQVVVFDPSWQKGGPKADEGVRKAVAEQLASYCRSGPAPTLNSWSFTVNRHTAKDTWRLSGTLGLGRLATYGCDIDCDYDTPGLGKLYVNWGSDPVAPPAGFDMDEFTTLPQVTDAELQQKLAGMPQLMADWATYQSEMRMLKQMPSQVLMELKQACAAPDPSATVSTSFKSVSSAFKPAAMAVLHIIPANSSSGNPTAASSSSSSSGSSAALAHVAAAATSSSSKRRKQFESDRLGVLRIEVFVFKRPGAHHRLIAEDYQEWNVDKVPGRRHYHTTPGNQLKNVMNARLLQEPGGYDWLKEIYDLGRADVRGIKKLMDWVVTPERDAAVQPAGLAVQMHPYQLQSLKFMQEAESTDGGWRALFWKWLPHAAGGAGAGESTAVQQYGAGSSARTAGISSNGSGVWWSPVLEKVSYSVPAAPWGGFLAEEMGLGKTIEVLGLVLSNPAPPSVVAGMVDPESSKIVSRGTLVVCAVSLVGQWCQEAQKKLDGSLVMYPYHGSSRIRDPMRLATGYDLVVTTYATLSSDYGKNGSGVRNPLHKIKWHRVVFDEGHTVKNAAAGHSKACAAVTADRRWICTGTPLSNDITDLFGQFGVLQMEPFGTKTWFDTCIKMAFLGHGYGMSLIPLLYTLRHTMVRHTKAQTISGQSVLALPEKTEELVPVVLSDRERSTYLEVHAKAAALWQSIRHFPPASINQRLIQIMSLLQPLRRICSGGSLTPGDLDLRSPLDTAHGADGSPTGIPRTAAAAAGGLGGAQAVNVQQDNTLRVPESTECPICLDSFETPVMTSCHHWFCKECILGVLSASNHCPLCRGTVDTSGLRAPGKNNESTPVVVKKTKRRRSSGSEGEESEYEDGTLDQQPQLQQQQSSDPNVIQCESKLKALVAELRAMRAADSSSKALVFSQYNSTLEWLKTRLPQEGFSFRTITGSMAQRQRAKAIDAFQSDPPTTVFLLSMRSGAVGINLTAATHVFMLEPCINPALEEQAIGRAWRMGQTRKVVVKRFYVKGSVEERIMDVRAMRQGHAAPAAADGAGSSAAAAAAGDDDPVVRTGKGRKSIIGASAIAGNLKADRQVLKIAELDLLFRTPELWRSSSSGAGSSAAAIAAAAAAGR